MSAKPDYKTFGVLIGTLFYARDMAHRRHLVCKGSGAYAEHIALEEFYTEIIDLADTITEAFIGRYNVDLDIPLVSNDQPMSVIELLESQREYIREQRYIAIPREETPLQNVMDEIELRYMRTLFKFRRLH